jgi:hypothetical protein
MKKFPDKDFRAETAMVDLLAVKAVDTARQKALEIITNIATGDERKIMDLGVKRYTKWTDNQDVIGLREIIASKLENEGKYTFNNY